MLFVGTCNLEYIEDVSRSALTLESRRWADAVLRFSALEVIFNGMRSINPRFTYLLTYLLTYIRFRFIACDHVSVSFQCYRTCRRRLRKRRGLSEYCVVMCCEQCKLMSWTTAMRSVSMPVVCRLTTTWRSFTSTGAALIASARNTPSTDAPMQWRSQLICPVFESRSNPGVTRESRVTPGLVNPAVTRVSKTAKVTPRFAPGVTHQSRVN